MLPSVKQDEQGGYSLGKPQSIEELQGLYHAVTNPLETAGKAVSGAVDFAGRVINPKSREDFQKVGRAGEGVAEMLVGGGALGKLGKAAKGADALGPVTDVIKHHNIAAKSAGFPMSESALTHPDLSLIPTIRKSAVSQLEELKATRTAEYKAPLENYFNTGNKLEAQGNYFSLHDPEYIQELRNIRNGLSKDGKVTKFTDEERRLAGEIEDALIGVEDSTGVRRPADLRVIDTLLKRLREKQYGSPMEGFSAVKSTMYEKMANRLENSVKKWVGEENYPKDYYAALSKDINKYNTTLGKQLTERQDIPYKPGKEAPFKNQDYDSLKNAVFKSKETVEELREMVKPQEFDRFVSQHISNELRGKTFDEARQWYEKNNWINDYPQHQKALIDYMRVMAEREGNANKLKWVKRIAMGAGAAAGGATVVNIVRGP